MLSLKASSEDLFILLAVFDTNGFSNAAKFLNCPVSRVTRSIAKLESIYGVSLFNRTTRKILPTDACTVFVQKIRPTLEALMQAEKALMQLHKKPLGILRVDAVNSFILHQLIPIVSTFKFQYPDIELALVSHDRIIDLIDQKTDVAIRVGPLIDSNLHATYLGKSPLRIVASNSYIQKFGLPLTLTDLMSLDVIGFTDREKFNQWPLSSQFFIKEPDCLALPSIQGEFLMVSPTITASSGETILGLCLAGHGLALLSNFAVSNYLGSGELVEVMPGLICHEHPRNNVNAVYYKNHMLSAKISVFIQFLQQHLKL